MVEDKLSIVDNGTVEISMQPIAVTRNLAPKYLKLFTKFSIELNNLILEDVISNSGIVGKADSVYRPDNNSIPLLMACCVENVSEISQLNVHLNERSVVCQSLYYNKYSNVEEMETLWEDGNN